MSDRITLSAKEFKSAERILKEDKFQCIKLENGNYEIIVPNKEWTIGDKLPNPPNRPYTYFHQKGKGGFVVMRTYLSDEFYSVH